MADDCLVCQVRSTCRSRRRARSSTARHRHRPCPSSSTRRPVGLDDSCLPQGSIECATAQVGCLFFYFFTQLSCSDCQNADPILMFIFLAFSHSVATLCILPFLLFCVSGFYAMYCLWHSTMYPLSPSVNESLQP